MVLRDFGMGKSLLEVRILEELAYFVEEFKKMGDTAFDPRLLIQYLFSNVICSIVSPSHDQLLQCILLSWRTLSIIK